MLARPANGDDAGGGIAGAGAVEQIVEIGHAWTGSSVEGAGGRERPADRVDIVRLRACAIAPAGRRPCESRTRRRTLARPVSWIERKGYVDKGLAGRLPLARRPALWLARNSGDMVPLLASPARGLPYFGPLLIVRKLGLQHPSGADADRIRRSGGAPFRTRDDPST
ncbi:hypothetical protein GCM10011322_07220 [Salinarimonas ramus]|uniref:Uncharacterized protein n=1 Tax=Salinarimonas ramus TaxID=690164 RepID=A0A917V1W7_9HYPH|nr:hypothetical protein GCM10011322_07220 [Salinarimonas ramus]